MPSRLDVLIRALGGTAAARLFGRHPSTICRWRTGERPLPADVASRMRELAVSSSQELIRVASELQTDFRQGVDRAARGRASRARASHNRALQARVAKLRALRDESYNAN